VSLALFFFSNKPFLGFAMEFLFVTTVQQFQEEEGKKNTHHHSTLQ
jgi:hypothetical protein